MRREIVDVMLTIALTYVAIMLALNLFAVGAPVQAAPEKAPESTPCVEVNTATLLGGGVITVFYCEPAYGIPYKINSLGFMLNEQ